ncbi:MarR family winged helix-turn-helix transcriptional regulator [Tardiphaga sp. P9-11]|uniref:MarR family winged helix-turn-helix transcriptional regulator n=1 Tax=Tardiphaga sp. P9-11 TaxID=2024614 RepID=UPI001FEE24ED|nr:MarR family winged helix-turn-helix transcriptional regulator [Tardiphaga sp. P9-11]
MSDIDADLIDHIRAASRLMVRELGFMQATVAATDYPPSAVHTLLEIGAREAMTAVELSAFLGLEKSSVSRMIRKLIDAGELKEAASAGDGRVKRLLLTAKGRRTREAIEAYGQRQVTNALQQLAPIQRKKVAEGLALYAEALEAHRLADAETPDRTLARRP